jgi:hypothetical protein
LTAGGKLVLEIDDLVPLRWNGCQISEPVSVFAPPLHSCGAADTPKLQEFETA